MKVKTIEVQDLFLHLASRLRNVIIKASQRNLQVIIYLKLLNCQLVV